MKKFLQGAFICGVLLVMSACVSGPVNDKRAPGEPGHKTYQVQIDDPHPIGPDKVWITVSERVWDRCRLDQTYPACEG